MSASETFALKQSYQESNPSHTTDNEESYILSIFRTVVYHLSFAFMGILHYIRAFTMSDEAWINFKTYGWIPIMLVFVIAQFAVLKNHLNPALTDKTTK